VRFYLDAEELGRDIRRSAREHDNALKEISRKEIEARNRVDITLHEYESMKAEIARLRSKVGFYESVFNEIRIPWHRKIIPGSIRVERCENYTKPTEMYHIFFEIDPLKGWEEE
jgi:hypothetical protein